MDNKVFTPEVLADTPFPMENEMNQTMSEPSGNVQTASAISDNLFPTKKIAVDTIGSSLNTKSRKIIQEFSFTQSGAIQVGTYELGVSGDIKISPNGIVARDSSGTTTFALDGTTGDAVFAGQIRAGSAIVADTIAIESSNTGYGRIVFYNDGLPSIVIGDPS